MHGEDFVTDESLRKLKLNDVLFSYSNFIE
jgi:hypothetical protein